MFTKLKIHHWQEVEIFINDETDKLGHQTSFATKIASHLDF